MVGDCARMPRTASCPVGQGAEAGLGIGLGSRDCWEDGGVRHSVREQAPYQHALAPMHATIGRRACNTPEMHGCIFAHGVCTHAFYQCGARRGSAQLLDSLAAYMRRRKGC